MPLKKLFALALLALSSSVSAAEVAAPPPIPRGTEFRVNASPGGFKPRITVFPDGGFLVVWTGNGARARFLDAAGRVAGPEIRLPGVTGSVDQVLADRDGSFLLVWTGVSATHPESNIFVRRFNRDGTPRGKRIRANLPSTYDRYDAVATIGPDGRFAIAWRADVPIPRFEDARYTDAVGRIFAANGTPLTPEITLLPGEEPTAAGDDTIHAFPSSLALRPNGTLAALVEERGSCFQSYLREVSREGEPVSSLQPLGSVFCGNPPSRNHLAASLAMGKDGSLVAAWSDGDVQAQRFGPDGTPRGEWFRVSPTLLYQYEPTVALQAGGTFVIAFTEENEEGHGEEIFGRAFAPSGRPRTQAFRINVTTEGNQNDPAIAAGRQGPAVVVWTSELPGARGGIFARVLSPDR